MSQRCNTEPNSEIKNYPQIIPKINEKSYDDWVKPVEFIPNGKSNFKNGYINNDETVIKDVGALYTKHSIPRSKKKKKDDEKFRSPNICIAKTELGGPLACNCNRHFTLNVPDLRKVEVTTSL